MLHDGGGRSHRLQTVDLHYPPQTDAYVLLWKGELMMSILTSKGDVIYELAVIPACFSQSSGDINFKLRYEDESVLDIIATRNASSEIYSLLLMKRIVEDGVMVEVEVQHDKNYAMAVQFPSAMKWYATFGGPHLPKLRKTAELLELSMSGDIPYMVGEFQMAKQKRKYPSRQLIDVEALELFQVISADMIGKFRVPSLGGAIFSHDFIERKRKIRFAYPVRSADADSFLLVFR